MITRAEAKLLADSAISEERKQEIENLFHERVIREATKAKYEANVNDITGGLSDNEILFAQNLLQEAPNLYSITDFFGEEHLVIWQ